jgi:hypothetical protein
VTAGTSGFLGRLRGRHRRGHAGTAPATGPADVHEGLATTAQIALFLLLGLLVFPSQLPAVALDGSLIALVLVLVARPLAALLCLAPFGYPLRQMSFIAWAGLRGAVPIVLATFPLTTGYDDGTLIFDVVFFVVLVSAIVQGFTITPVAARLGLRADPGPWAEVAEMIPLDAIGVDIFELEIPVGSPVIDGTLAVFPLPGDARVIARHPGAHRRRAERRHRPRRRRPADDRGAGPTRAPGRPPRVAVRCAVPRRTGRHVSHNAARCGGGRRHRRMVVRSTRLGETVTGSSDCIRFVSAGAALAATTSLVLGLAPALVGVATSVLTRG